MEIFLRERKDLTTKDTERQAIWEDREESQRGEAERPAGFWWRFGGSGGNLRDVSWGEGEGRHG